MCQHMIIYEYYRPVPYHGHQIAATDFPNQPFLGDGDFL